MVKMFPGGNGITFLMNAEAAKDCIFVVVCQCPVNGFKGFDTGRKCLQCTDTAALDMGDIVFYENNKSVNGIFVL